MMFLVFLGFNTNRGRTKYGINRRDGYFTSIKYLWSVGGKGQGLSLHGGASHTHTLRLG